MHMYLFSKWKRRFLTKRSVMNAKHTEGGLELSMLVYLFQGAGSCDSFLQHVTHKTQAAHLLVKIIHWLMHGDLEMLVGILKLLALPSICLATTCDVSRSPWFVMNFLECRADFFAYTPTMLAQITAFKSINYFFTLVCHFSCFFFYFA